MDKNIKQELESLKSQVLATLKNIETALNNLDDRVEQVSEQTQGYSEKVQKYMEQGNWTKVVRETMDMDRWEHIEFIGKWAQNKQARIDAFCEVLATTCAEVKNFQPIELSVKNLEDANNVLTQMQNWEATKHAILSLLTDPATVYTPLHELSEATTDDDFVIFHKIQTDLADAIMNLPCADASGDLKVRCISTLSTLSELSEMEIQKPLQVVDPQTFEIKNAPADKQDAHKKLEFMRYRKALKQALEYHRAHEEAITTLRA